MKRGWTRAALALTAAVGIGLGLAGGQLRGAQAEPAGVGAPVVPGAEMASVATAGRVDTVTVYRGQALVTRVVDVQLRAGVAEVVVTDLPERIVGSSLFAEGDANVEVRNITYRTRVVAQDVREQVRKFDADIRDLDDKITAVRRQLATLAEHRAYLTKLENFTAPTANTELTRGVLNAETLAKLTSLLLEQRSDVAAKELAAGRQLRDLQEQADLLRVQRAEIAGASSRVAREAVVFVNLKNARAAIRLNYLVDSATWTPSYNVRSAGADGKVVAVEYNAAIQQSSGEDWREVQMTLSTATPSLVAMSPGLQEMSVALARVTEREDVADERKYETLKSQVQEQSRNFASNAMTPTNGTLLSTGAQSVNAGTLSPGVGTGFGGAPMVASPIVANTFALNQTAGDLQRLELVSKFRPATQPAGGVVASTPTAAEEDVSVSYALASRTSLPSRPDRQLIQIASMGMKAEHYRVASPVLTPQVYQQAQVTNDSKLVLLAGPVMSFVSGQFVGHGAIGTVAAGQSFVVGLGVDTNLRASREVVDRTETIQGGNRVITTKVRLAVENFGAAAVPVRVMDRIPASADASLQITLVPPATELSADATYLATQRKRGILRWDVLPGGQAIGTKALAVEYVFKVEFDKQMSLTTGK